MVASGTPHAHSSSVVSMPAQSDRELMAKSLAGFARVVGRAGVSDCNHFSLTAAEEPRAELQVPASIRACEHDSHR